jgi:hypothetical protein
MSGEQMLQTAPRLATARKTAIVWGVFGSTAQTRSPRCTPMRCSAAAKCATWRWSPGHESSLTCPCASIASSAKTMAGCPAACAASAWRKTWRAKLSCAPGNQRAPGMRSSASTALCGVGDSMAWKSQIDCQKASRSVTDHCQSWS